MAPDIAPLAWVIDEIRTSLDQAVAALRVFVAAKADLEPLRSARSHVHQANGALQLLDLRGVALVSEAIERTLARFETDPRECLPAAVRTIESAASAVLAYLDGLLAGRQTPPMLLFPYYRDVLVLQKAARVHPADLLFPDLTRRPAFHTIEARQFVPEQLRDRRARFETGLLGLLRKPDDPAPRTAMRAALAELEQMPQRGLARSFWWIVRGLLEAIEGGQLAVDLDLKRLLARINLQLRRMIDGGGAVAERLMVDTLYYVGRATSLAPRVVEIKRLYGLASLIPADFERPLLTAVDGEDLRALKEALLQAKTHWNALVGGEAADGFIQEAGAARDAAQRLAAAPMVDVLNAAQVVARDFAHLTPAARELVALEVAAALLFVELGVDELPQLDAQYGERAAAVVDRLNVARSGAPLEDAGPWLTDLARRAQDRLTMSTVVLETQGTLREIEQRLDRFFRAPAERADLAATGSMFDQVAGILGVLGFDDPVSALHDARDAVQAFADPAVAADPHEFARIAQNLGAVGFFVDGLGQDEAEPRATFRWDPVRRSFSAEMGQYAAPATPSDDEALAARGAEPRAPEARRRDNVENAVRNTLEAAHRAALRLTEASGDARAIGELARALPALSNEADLLDDERLKQRVLQATQLFTQLEQRSSDRALARQLEQALAPQQAPVAPPTAPLPTSDAAADHELHSIFVEEAREVLANIDEQLSVLQRTPADQATQTTLRRAFHTLKGSSRMVGLKAFGEGAWAIEQCFNLWLAQERAADHDLLQLAATARHVLGAWVDALDADPAVQFDPQPLVLAAQRVREGGAFEYTGGTPVLAPARAPAAAEAPAPAVEADRVAEFHVEAAPAPADPVSLELTEADLLEAGLSEADLAAVGLTAADLAEAAAVEREQAAAAREDGVIAGVGMAGTTPPESSGLAPAELAALAEGPLDFDLDAPADALDAPTVPLSLPPPAAAGTAFATPDFELTLPPLPPDDHPAADGALEWIDAAPAVPADDPALEATGDPATEDVRRIGPIEISHGLYSVFLNEADECIRVLAQDVAEWRFEPARAPSFQAVRRAHSLAGIAATVGLTPVHDVVEPLDALLHTLSQPLPGRHFEFAAAEFDTLDRVIERTRGMLHQFSAGFWPSAAPLEAGAVHDLLAVVRAHAALHESAPPPATDEAPATLPALAAESLAVEALAGPPSEVDVEAALPGDDSLIAPIADAVVEVPAALDAPHELTADEAEVLAQLLRATAVEDVPLPIELDGVAAAAAAAAHAEDAPAARIDAAAAEPEGMAAPAAGSDAAAAGADAPAAPAWFHAAPAAGPAAEADLAAPAPSDEPADAEIVAHFEHALPPPAAPREVVVPAVRDELDPELLDVFLTEAGDILPAVAGELRALAAAPDDRAVARELMRRLHTVKGSARMAGAMRLGERMHDMETRIEAAMQLSHVPLAVVEALQAQYDDAMQLFDALQAGPTAPVAVGATAAATAPLAPVFDLAAARAEARGEAPADAAAGAGEAAAPTAPSPLAPAAPAQAAAQAPAAPTFIRVRADVLDKLVDQAGEVSIARARLENEIGTIKSSVTDLTENIQRLRAQLREVEIQADAQLQARGDKLSRESADFDPLEFDRYTRLQELTRLLAESVEDVAMVQSTMLRGLQLADGDLTAQGRLTRELQQQLMRVRLVPFATLSERLYRLTRQTAKELGKRVNLEIRGGSTEIDRGVLERMAGPFEHLIRNAIVHGLETPAVRVAAGKPETGELTLELRQEGNEIVVLLADDGAGIDLARVRSHAIERQLLPADSEASERELVELIFVPGLSTAGEITELAGRGVGMDVVRSELSGFGGRIAASTEAGRGTRFTLYLPMTLAVAQVVLATIGERRYAIPAGMVEQVRRHRPAPLLQALAQGMLEVAPHGPVVLRPLAQLLGEPLKTQLPRQTPVVLLKSGDDRLAVVVDEVSSNQEVVVKNVGVQVARLAGILGATILGNGEIVLIINPVQLIARAPEPAPLFEATADEAGADDDAGAADAAVPQAPQVMVVDDSLTVRRVTQRLLERNGFQVLLAKDGVDALRQLQDARPDVMLVDIEMPRMDGYDLTRNVRNGPATAAIPIIMITSRTADKHRRMALEVGVNEYLGKPYQEAELLGLIRAYLARAGASV